MEYEARMRVWRLPDGRGVKVGREREVGRERKTRVVEGTRKVRINPFTRGRTKKGSKAGRGMVSERYCED